MSSLSRLVINGFKSIQTLDLPLSNFNLLIGANGVGKSNIIALFKMIHALMEKELQLYVVKEGGADLFLYDGHQKTSLLSASFHFESNSYQVDLEPTVDDKLVFVQEVMHFQDNTSVKLSGGYSESLVPKVMEKKDYKEQVQPLVTRIRDCAIYHFRNTSQTFNIKRLHTIYDHVTLRHDGSNLAAFLYKLQNTSPKHYENLCHTIRQIIPTFHDFYLKPYQENSQTIQLKWIETGCQFPFTANELSDGTLHFICLATLLLQPHIPKTVLIDEPESGLHPKALSVLASLLREASKRCQLIVLTQSANLVEQFEVETIIVVEKENEQSVFRRFEQQAQLQHWLKKYRSGE